MVSLHDGPSIFWCLVEWNVELLCVSFHKEEALLTKMRMDEMYKNGERPSLISLSKLFKQTATKSKTEHPTFNNKFNTSPSCLHQTFHQTPQTPIKMKLRAATLADVPAIAAISLSAFAEDPLYAHFFPFRGKHTHDYQQSFIDEATRFMLTPGHVMLVAEIYEEDPEGVAEIENTTEYNTYFNSNSTGGLNDDEFWCRGTGTGISTPALSTNSSSGLFSPPLPPPSIAQRIDSGYESASSVSTTQSTVSSLGSKGRSLSTKWRTVIVGYASFVRHGTAEERQGWNPDSSRMSTSPHTPPRPKQTSKLTSPLSQQNSKENNSTSPAQSSPACDPTAPCPASTSSNTSTSPRASTSAPTLPEAGSTFGLSPSTRSTRAEGTRRR